jgi:hypothetical protein
MTDESVGTVTIAPEVLMDVVRLTALATPGVAGLSPDHPNRVSRMFSGKISRGIRLELEDSTVSIDLHIIIEPETQMLPLGQTLSAKSAARSGRRRHAREGNQHPHEDVADLLQQRQNESSHRQRSNKATPALQRKQCSASVSDSPNTYMKVRRQAARLHCQALYEMDCLVTNPTWH